MRRLQGKHASEVVEAMPELSEAYVVGLLSEAEQRVPQLTAELTATQKRAGAVDAELQNLLRRMTATKKATDSTQQRAKKSGATIQAGNMQIAALHQEIATLKKKTADIKVEMARVRDDPALRRRLRRQRAKLTVQSEEREEELATIGVRVANERETLAGLEASLAQERERALTLDHELKTMQSQLPSPHLYTALCVTTAARAHCRFFLQRDRSAWEREMRAAIGWSHQLHRELRLGKYPLDRHSDLVGGRAMATAEATYGAMAIGDALLARSLFELATDPGLFFHQIFNVFRIWCLGLFLNGRQRELRQLLRQHQFAPGLRGGYVQAFIGLETREPKRLAYGLRDIAKHEWELWQDPRFSRGAGVINLGAVAISRLAGAFGMRPFASAPGELGLVLPTVPPELLAAPLPPAALPFTT